MSRFSLRHISAVCYLIRMQAILTDPFINNLLKDMQTNPQAAQRAMSDARVASQIEKLMVAGKKRALNRASCFRALFTAPSFFWPQAY